MYEFEAKLEIFKDKDVSFLHEPDSLEIEKQWKKFLQFPSCKNLIQNYLPNKFLFQSDFYYNHPLWDYKEKDMALRNRKEVFYVFDNNTWTKQKNISLLTFKNKSISSEFKLRKEFEFEINDQIWEVLEENGFSKTTAVHKYRWLASTPNESKNKTHLNFDKIDIAFDLVAGLGYYLELEVMLEDTDFSQDKDIAEKRMKNFMNDYGLTHFKKESVSYLGLLLHETT